MAKAKDTEKENPAEQLAKIIKDHAARLNKLEKGTDGAETEIETRLRNLEQAVGLTPRSTTLKQARKAAEK